MGKPRDQWTAEDYRAATEEARREARFRSAGVRIRRIAAAAPPLTPAQRAELALILCPDSGSDAPAT